MINFERPALPPRQQRQLETAPADTQRVEGLLEYVAMMADVELPVDEDEEADHE